MLTGKRPVTSPALQRLFPLPYKEFRLPPLEESDTEKAWDEIELLGFPVTLSWFDLLTTSFRGEARARDLLQYTGRKVRMVGLLVHIKNVRTVRGEWMHFGTWLDAEGEFFDTVHFPASLKKYPFHGPGIYLILGRVTEEYGVPSLETEKMARLEVRRPKGAMKR
jgi:DNA polymerase-3 subunit alpha